MNKVTILNGHVLDHLRKMLNESVHCVVTSPPYWGLRDYGVEGQIGLEKTIEEYVGKMVEIFREVRRVLRQDGVCFLNLGDSYAASGPPGGKGIKHLNKGSFGVRYKKPDVGLKPKDLCGIPWRVALALQADGWWLRSDIIWSKPNPMPESVTDRPTRSHEYIFLLTKSAKYFYDSDAVREVHAESSLQREKNPANQRRRIKSIEAGMVKSLEWKPEQIVLNPNGRNLRSVWNIPTQPFPDAHFATFPIALVEKCIKAGSPENGIVFDPFLGSGTTCLCAAKLNRDSIGIELKPEYVALAKKRIKGELGFLVEILGD